MKIPQCGQRNHTYCIVIAPSAILILLGNEAISIAGLVLALGAMTMQYVWFRCPHCGIFIQLWHYREGGECPQCGKKLG